jgi:hypothetical protein
MRKKYWFLGKAFKLKIGYAEDVSASHKMRVCAFINAGPLIAAEGYFFCLETKEAKIHTAKRLFAHKAFTPQAARTAGCKILPQLRSHKPHASGKYCYALATAQPTIVLPAFAQSFFADGETKEKISFGSLVTLRKKKVTSTNDHTTHCHS